ncbi:hypothetical protein [Niveibacterium sp. COAC-50]|uniref:hypothetical protein n=1 Tax=Niveibacterium sp. COAC-50 TaxID=2729384 RepID=UPI001555E5C5|nr:hypothetical protein [Niveibacterium sp. COAC-50]
MTPHAVDYPVRAPAPDDQLDEIWCATQWGDPSLCPPGCEPAERLCERDIGEFDLPPEAWV